MHTPAGGTRGLARSPYRAQRNPRIPWRSVGAPKLRCLALTEAESALLQLPPW